MRIIGVTITRTEMLLVGIALLVRAVYFFWSTSSPYFNHPVLDALWIHQWAGSLAAGEPQPTDAYFRAPLYPYLVSIVYRIAGATPWVVAALQHLIGALMVGLLYRLGRRVAGESVGVVAALLLAFYWVAVFFEGELLIVTLASALGLAFLLALASGADAPRGRTRMALLGGAGLLLGLAAVARPNYLVLVPLALGWPLYVARLGRGGEIHERTDASGAAGGRGSPRVGRLRLGDTAVIVFGILLPILPVTIRNVWVAGDPVLISAQGGLNLYVGNGPSADGKTASAPGEVLPLARATYQTAFRDNVTLAGRALAESGRGRRLKESEVSRFWLEKTWTFATQHPEAVVERLLRKMIYLINGFEISDNRDLREAQRAIPWLYVCVTRLSWVLPFALVGLLISTKTFKKSHLIVFFLLLYSISIVLFFVNARFRLPLAPGLFLLAGLGILEAAELVRHPRGWLRPWGARVGGVLLAGALTANARPFEIDERRGAPAFQLNHAFLLLEQGDCDRALQTYERLVREAPTMFEAAYQRARALQRCGDLRGALAAYDDVTQRWPEAGVAYLERGRVLAELGDTDAAVEAFSAGIDAATAGRRPATEVAALYFAHGLLELRRGAYEAAAAAYRRGLEIEETRLSAWINYGYTLLQLDQLQPARNAFLRVLALDPRGEEAGLARRNLQRIEQRLNDPAREAEGEGER